VITFAETEKTHWPELGPNATHQKLSKSQMIHQKHLNCHRWSVSAEEIQKMGRHGTYRAKKQPPTTRMQSATCCRASSAYQASQNVMLLKA
jgi:hypothetical protein